MVFFATSPKSFLPLSCNKKNNEKEQHLDFMFPKTPKTPKRAKIFLGRLRPQNQ